MTYIDKAKVDAVLDIVPDRAKACYTGQSILAYAPDPTFTWEEIDQWEDSTDVDIFCYNNESHAAVVQAYCCAGFAPANDIEAFKAERIRFFEPNRRFTLQTVSLQKEGLPPVNISWSKGVDDALDCIKRFDMDYLLCSMDMKTRIFADLRPENKRIAHVNPYHDRFDPEDVEPGFWYRQFDRCPKGWSRGVDTRPVAEQYKKWIQHSLALGDKTTHSKTRFYHDRMMKDSIKVMVDAGFDEKQAIAIYKLVKGEQDTWESQAVKHRAMLERIDNWLAEVR